MSSCFLSGSFRPFFFSVSFVILCPVRKSYGPVCKKHEMRPFAHKKEPITKPFLTFDHKEKKSMLKFGIQDMVPEKKVYWFIDPLNSEH